MANYTCAYGLRFEIESRYAPDVAYLLDNRVPDAADYGDVINRRISLMQSVPRRGNAVPEAGDRLPALKRRLLWRGRFIDEEGFTFRGQGLVAKGFAPATAWAWWSGTRATSPRRSRSTSRARGSFPHPIPSTIKWTPSAIWRRSRFGCLSGGGNEFSLADHHKTSRPRPLRRRVQTDEPYLNMKTNSQIP